MVRFLLLSLWILAIGGGSAQKISGQTVYKAHVSDAEGNAVEYATAVLLSGEKQVGGAVANSDGDFSMEAEAGKYRLVVQCLGYEPLRKELILPIKRRDSLILDLSNHVLREVVVRAKNIERRQTALSCRSCHLPERMVRNYYRRHRVCGSRMERSRLMGRKGRRCLWMTVRFV